MATINDLPTMSLNELKEMGYLQEVNRQFFHPIGLALAVIGDNLKVIDGRSEDEGIRFSDEVISKDKFKDKKDFIEKVFEDSRSKREPLLGYFIQE